MGSFSEVNRHVSREDTLDHQASDSRVVSYFKPFSPVVYRIPKQVFKCCSDVMIFKHALVVVSERNRALYFRQKNIFHVRMLEVVSTCSC